jgi:hypothetical protein
MYLNQLRYPLVAKCTDKTDQFGAPEMTCDIDRSPIVSLEEVKEMIEVTFNPDVSRQVNVTITPLPISPSVSHSENIFRFVYNFRVLEEFDSKEDVKIDFRLRTLGSFTQFDDLVQMELRLKSPSFGCGREGCFAKKAVEKKPVVQASSFLWITTPLGATFILVAGIVLVIVLVAAFRCVRSVWHPRNDSTSDIPDHLRCRFPHSWPSHGR